MVWILCALSSLVLLPVLGWGQLAVVPSGGGAQTVVLTDCSGVTGEGVFCLDTDAPIPVLYVGTGAGIQRVGGDAYVVQNDCSTVTQLGTFCLDGDASPNTLYVGTGAGVQQVGPGVGAGDITDVAGCATGDCFSSVTQNTVFAGPDGSDGEPVFRAVVVGDLPAVVVREDTSNTFGAASVNDFGAAALEIPNSTTLPATCTVGQLYADTDATTGQRLYLCQATNTWALQGDGGGGTPTLDAVMAVGDTYSGADNPGTALTVCNTADTECVELYVDATTGSRLRFRVSGTYQSLDERCEAAGDRDLFLGNGNTCVTINCTTGLWTFANEQSCRWAEEMPFDAGSLNVDGTHCVQTAVALNSFPARLTISCADNDTGRMVLTVPRMPGWWDAGVVDVHWCAQSITNQNGLTVVLDHQVVCTADNEVRAAAPATGTTNTLTLTFGNQANDLQCGSVSITTSGCAVGEELALIADNEDSGTATQSSTTAVLLGGKIVAYRATSR